MIATQNPIELEGTFPLPEAQLDRFLLRLKVDYPSAEEEQAMLFRFKETQPLDDLAPVLAGEQLLRLFPAVRAVRVANSTAGYLVAVIRRTREHPAVELGASPRAALALFRAAQALAAMRGRAYVKPDDIKELAEPVLSHRLLLSAQSRVRDQSASLVVREVLERTPVPVEDVSGDR